MYGVAVRSVWLGSACLGGCGDLAPAEKHTGAKEGNRSVEVLPWGHLVLSRDRKGSCLQHHCWWTRVLQPLRYLNPGFEVGDAVLACPLTLTRT